MTGKLHADWTIWPMVKTMLTMTRLERVEAGGNWLFPFDQISPIEI